MIFSFSGAARVCSASWTECTTHLRRGNCRYSFVVRVFWRANGSDFLSRRAHSFCFPRPIRRPFSRAQATGTSCHDLHIWFSAETLCSQSSFSSLGLTFRPLLTLFWSNSKVTYVQAGVSFDQWNGAFCFHLGQPELRVLCHVFHLMLTTWSSSTACNFEKLL